MGCSNSKLDDLPAVTLCRDRCNFLEEALRQSHALADAHVAYMQSLRSLGPTLHRFFTQITDHSTSDQPQPSKPSPPHDHSRSVSLSNSNSNSNSNSDSEPEGTEKETDYFGQIHHNYQTIAPSPPPPSNSAWDFLNFFDTYERYEPLFEHREEVHDFEPKVVKKKTEGRKKLNDAAKNVVVPEKDQSETPICKQGVSEAMREIQALFDKASESGNEVLKLIEVRILRCHQKIAVNQVSCKVFHAITPSLPRRGMEKPSPLVMKIGPDHEDMGLSSGDISSILEKLCMWEKKLYDEVKAEEKLRTIHEKKCKQLKRMDERSADAYKIDSTQSLIWGLSTKMKISIQVIDRVSITINKLRDEEFLQQINKLILGLVGMWKAMLDCHKCQCQAFGEGKSLDAITSNGKFSYAHLEAAIELKFELQNWSLRFFNWIVTQKAHVKALNGWLLRCLLYEPEETLDGIVPFSPGRIGAPTVFVICNQWSQAMDRVSEKEVIEAMQGFFVSLNQLLEPHILDLRQRATGDKDMERKIKILEMEEQRIQKMVQAQEKKMGPVLPRSEVPKPSSLMSDLKQIFVAMERFTANSVQAYEELCVHIQEDKHV